MPQAVERLHFDVISEPWSSIRLIDGTVIRLRLVVTDIFAPGGIDSDGHPNISIRSTTVVSTIWPEDGHVQVVAPTSPSVQ